MPRFATKAPYELEDEEITRLISPSPKQKPPRKDLQRHHIEPEDDPDLKVDKTAYRVIAKFLGAASDDFVDVWNKEKKQRVQVKPETLKAEPGLYEPYKDQDAEEEPSADTPGEYPAVEKPKIEPAQREKSQIEVDNAYAEVLNPKSMLFNMVKTAPNAPVTRLFPTLDFPPGVKTFLDLQNAAMAQQVAKKHKPKKHKILPGVGLGRQPEVQPKQVAGKPEAKPSLQAEPQPDKKVEKAFKDVLNPNRPFVNDPQVRKDPVEQHFPGVPGAEPKVTPKAVPVPAVTPDIKAKPIEEPKTKEPEDVSPELATVFDEVLSKDPAWKQRLKDNPQVEVEYYFPRLELPAGVTTLADLKDAATAWRNTTETPKWVTRGGANTPEFKEFADKDNTVSTASDGTLLFANPRAKGTQKGKKVPFKDLPQDVQAAWHDKYQAEAGLQKSIDTLQKDIPEDSKKLLADLVNPATALGQKLQKLDSREMADLDIVKALPELKGHVPEGFQSLGQLTDAAKKAFPPKPAPPAPLRRAVTPEEEEETSQYIRDELPPGMIAPLMHLHPDDIRQFVKQFKAAQAKPPSHAELLKSVQGAYATDINNIPDPPPELLEGLSPDKQADAVQKYKLDVLTRSLIARDQLSDMYDDAGIPYAVARKMADTQLSSTPGKQVPEEVVNKQADDVFDRALTMGRAVAITPAQVAKALETAKGDPRTQKLITAFMQGNDYWLAKEKFLSPKSEDAFDERSKPKQIVQGLLNAHRFLTNKAKQYPEDAQRHDTAKAFRLRVLSKLKTLDPAKYADVKKLLLAEDSAIAQKQWKRYDKLNTRYQADHEKWKALQDTWEEWHKNHPEVTKAKEPKKPGPEPLAPKPVEPPLGHEPTDEDIQASKRLWTKQAFVGGLNMTHRTAVYNGIAPYSNTKAYPGWGQGSQHTLSEAEYGTVISAAKDWLKTSFLTKHYEGVPKDVSYRAALDLAIRSSANGKYAAAFTAQAYEKALRELAGVPATGTLLTLQASKDSSYTNTRSGSRVLTQDNEVPMSMPKFSSENADQILFRLDRLASTIQGKFASWGMPFEVAKGIVNDLDKVADEIEVASFGKESLMKRQAEVIQHDADETYMTTFANPMAPIQTDADEAYMAAYKDDQSSCVDHGKSTTGRPLAP